MPKVADKSVDQRLRAAGFQIAERIPGREPVWAFRFKRGEKKLYKQREAVRILEGRR